MGFTTNDNMVEVNFFKETGKWYTTEEMNWDRYFGTNPHDKTDFKDIRTTFRRCLRKQFGDSFKDMIAVCLNPYHEHSHPVMAMNWHNDD